MGCGAQCTLKHVVLGECIACDDTGTRKRLAEMQRAVTEMDDEVVRPTGVRGNKGTRTAKGGDEGQGAEEGVRMSAQEREDARGATWGGQLRAVRRVLTRAMAGKCTEEGDWQALRQMLVIDLLFMTDASNLFKTLPVLLLLLLLRRVPGAAEAAPHALLLG